MVDTETIALGGLAVGGLWIATRGGQELPEIPDTPPLIPGGGTDLDLGGLFEGFALPGPGEPMDLGFIGDIFAGLEGDLQGATDQVTDPFQDLGTGDDIFGGLFGESGIGGLQDAIDEATERPAGPVERFTDDLMSIGALVGSPGDVARGEDTTGLLGFVQGSGQAFGAAAGQTSDWYRDNVLWQSQIEDLMEFAHSADVGGPTVGESVGRLASLEGYRDVLSATPPGATVRGSTAASDWIQDNVTNISPVGTAEASPTPTRTSTVGNVRGHIEDYAMLRDRRENVEDRAAQLSQQF